MENDVINFMNNLWVVNDDGIALIGINEEGAEEITAVRKINLPSEDEDVSTEEACGDIEMDDGTIDIYSPVDGRVIEINAAVIENPDLIVEDPYGDGWLIRVEPFNSEDMSDLEEGVDLNDQDD